MKTIDEQIDYLLKAHPDMSIEKIRAFVESLSDGKAIKIDDGQISPGVAEYIESLNPAGKVLFPEKQTALEGFQKHEPQKLDYAEILKNIKTE